MTQKAAQCGNDQTVPVTVQSGRLPVPGVTLNHTGTHALYQAGLTVQVGAHATPSLMVLGEPPYFYLVKRTSYALRPAPMIPLTLSRDKADGPQRP